MGNDSWWDLAACYGMDVELFYSSEETDVAEALAVCDRCVVRTLCREHAMSSEERFGVWGGTLDTDRRGTFRKRRRAAQPQRRKSDAA